jgi:polysaccharide chain length determinant protein (PEP-CTERM system associated)
VTRSHGADTFSIIFTGTNPELVMRVANWLATSFINENLRMRESQVSGTSDFLSGELQTMRKRLQEVEATLGRYRKQYMGELPEQLDTNLRILDGLQRQLNEKQISLRDAKNRLVALENQIEARKRLQALQMEVNRNVSASSGTKPSQPDKLLTLRELKAQLRSLRASYTDQHPDVINLKSKIEKLERNAGKQGYGSITELEQNQSENKGQLVADNILADHIQQRSEIKVEIHNLESDIAKIQFQVKGYQKRVEVTPKREEELLSLKRDYQNIQDSYKSLLNRKLEAEIAANMEKKQKGEQFRIIDPARLPKKPISPDLQKLFMMAVAVGLGIGGGLIFLLDFFNTSLKNLETFEEDLGVTVLATIPKVYQKKDVNLKRLNLVLTAASIVVAVCLTAGFAALVLNGVEPTIEIVRPYLAFLKI